MIEEKEGNDRFRIFGDSDLTRKGVLSIIRLPLSFADVSELGADGA